MPEGGQRIVIPYNPRPIFKPFHERKQRWSASVAHRRAGKTVARINQLVKDAMLCPLVEPRYAYVAPTFAQAKDVAWSYLCRYTAPIPGAVPYVNELRIDLPNGGRVRLYGADNYERMRGIYLDGLVCDEYGLMDPRAWSEVLRPTLADRKGWADFVGTPAGRNHFAKVCETAQSDPEWYYACLRASETKLLDEGELADARKVMTPEQYAAEFECSFDAGVVGAYYGREMHAAEAEGRITVVPWEPQLQVHTAWDIGRGDSTAIWFAQVKGLETRLIDYHENSGVGLDAYAKVLREKPYVYGEHFWPHDGGNDEWLAGSRVEAARTLLGKSPRVLERRPKEDSINGARLFIPRCRFDATKCERGISALRNYRQEFDEKLKAFKGRPLHDWSSHASDSFAELAASNIRPDDGWDKPINYPKTQWTV